MALVMRGGKLVMVGGKLATNTDCCCEAGETCGACGETWPDEIQVDIDAAAATGNPAEPFADCEDGDCQDLSGTYILSKVSSATSGTWGVGSGGDTPVNIATFNWADTCQWELHIDDNPETLPCVSVNYGDVLYYGLQARVALASDGDYYLWVSVYWSDAVPYGSGVGSGWEWLKNLGNTAPDCMTISEAFTGENYVYKGTIQGTTIEDVTDPCYYDTITLDVLAI